MDHPEHNPPKSTRELIERITAPLRDLFNEPLPEGVGWFQTTGSMCLLMIGMQFATGILMAFYYTPSADVAWESVRFIDEKVTFGSFIHGLHHWGSSAFVVIIFIHMLRVFTFGAYKGNRKWTWLAGVGLFLVVLGFGFTGYLLPWDLKAYFGTQVGTNIAGKTPFLGPYVRSFLLGGPEISELTLPRFYALHVFVLPICLLTLTAVHLFLVRTFGITAPWKRDDEPVTYPETFFPGQAVRDSFMALVVLSVLFTLAWKVGAHMEAKADPTIADYAPHPEWYFLGLQQLLRYFTGPLEIVGAVIIPGLVVLGMLLLPFIDRNPERRLTRRPIALATAVTGVSVSVVLTVMGYRELVRHREELKVIAMHEEIDKARETDEKLEASLLAATEMRLEAEKQAADADADPGDAAAAPTEFSKADADGGAVLYEKLECADCHTGPAVGKGMNIPPDLSYAGDRFTPGWMMTYLREVPPRRYTDKDRHPVERMPDYRFTDNELRLVTAYLMTLSRPELFNLPEGIRFDASTPEKVEKGREFYDLEGCAVCHKLNGEGVNKAPDLTGVGSRLRPEFIYKIVQLPHDLIPDMDMEESFLLEEEIESLTYYLMEQK